MGSVSSLGFQRKNTGHFVPTVNKRIILPPAKLTLLIIELNILSVKTLQILFIVFTTVTAKQNANLFNVLRIILCDM